jgi:hypothetical protein
MRNLLDWEYVVAQSWVMRTLSRLSRILRVGLMLTLVLGVVLGTPIRAQASILAGCVGTDDTAVPGVVGWVDVGVMLGTEAARAPGLTTVVAPDGTATNFLNGEGLIPPNDEMPIWFAPVNQLGDYIVTNDGDECKVAVTALAEDEKIRFDSINIDWEVHSALVK